MTLKWIRVIVCCFVCASLCTSCAQQPDALPGAEQERQAGQNAAHNRTDSTDNAVVKEEERLDGTEMQRTEPIDLDEDFLASLHESHRHQGVRIFSQNGVRVVVDGVALNLQPAPFVEGGTTYLPLRALSTHFGAGVWWNATSKTVGVNHGEKSISFILGATTANVNGTRVNVAASIMRNGSVFVPIRFIAETFGYRVGWDDAIRTISITTAPRTYTVVAGDTLWSIAKRFGSTVDAWKSVNRLTSDVVRVNQVLVIPDVAAAGKTGNGGGGTGNGSGSAGTASGTASDNGQSQVSVRYVTHKVQSGDTAWNLSVKYGVPMLELLKVNQWSINDPFSIGQELKIPVYTVPVKTATSARHGELLDWWTEARYVMPIGKEATIIDFATGRSFRVRHTMGGNHADAEPVTAQDAQVMKEIWGGAYSWTPRAIIVSVDGRKLAAAMHSFPHGDESIRAANNYVGHFCIHFLNSTRHKDGLVQDSMQRQIKIAAGV